MGNRCAVCGTESRRGLRVRWRWQVQSFRCKRCWLPAMGHTVTPTITLGARLRRFAVHVLGGITLDEYTRGVLPVRRTA